MKIKSANFIISNSDYKRCPTSDHPEFAFIGRSNVGKSSLINNLVNRKALAKISGKPGKTQLINHFEINENWFLVDLPGYGWAKVSKKSRAEFSKIIQDYLLNRQKLMNTYVLIDIRLEPQAKDINFINWLGENQLAFSIVFTKCDKLGKNKVIQSATVFKNKLTETWERLPEMILSSSVTGQGRDELLESIDLIIQQNS